MSALLNRPALIVGGVLVLAALAYYVKKKNDGSGGGVFAPGALDVTSRNNLAYTGVNEVGKAITGNKDFTLGVALWEFFNPAQAAQDERVADPVKVTTPFVPQMPAWYDVDRSPFMVGA